jgi:hypothetical protein
MRILIDIGIYLFGVLSGITCIALAAAGRKNFDEGRDENSGVWRFSARQTYQSYPRDRKNGSGRAF